MIEILEHKGPVGSERVSDIEKEIDLILPKQYLDFVTPNDGCSLKNISFIYFDEDIDRLSSSCISDFMSLKEDTQYHEDLLSMNKRSPDFFPKGLIKFGHVGNGDYICFDYREGKDAQNPPVVYWNHEAEDGKDVSFIAENFNCFLKMLKPLKEVLSLMRK